MKYDSYRCSSCAELCEAFIFLMENIDVQFDDMVYQQIEGIPMGINCAPCIADLFCYCYERDFMSDLHKSKRHDLIYMFNYTSRYLDDIFTINKPEFEKYIPDIYPTEFQLNKANISDKETSSLTFKYKKLLAVTFIPAFTTNAMTSDFLLLISDGQTDGRMIRFLIAPTDLSGQGHLNPSIYRFYLKRDGKRKLTKNIYIFFISISLRILAHACDIS